MHLSEQPEVVAVVLTIVVDTVDQELATAERLDALCELDGIEAAALAPPLHGALVPAERLAARPSQTARLGAARRSDRMVD